MTTAIERHEGNGAALATSDWNTMQQQARALVASGFLPRAINTPEKAIALALAGRELGLPMMQAIRSLHIIDGKPVMSADLMAALVHRKIPGALLRVAESTNAKCAVEAARPGQPTTLYVFTIEDAKNAGLLGKDNWRKYPRAMLRARCIAEAARATFADALLGVYDPDELGAETEPSGEVVVLPEQRDELPKISPYHEDDYNPSAADPPRLMQLIEDAEKMMLGGELIGAREMLGSRARRIDGSAAAEIQKEKEAGNITLEYHRELSRNWLRVERQLAKREALPPVDVVATLMDPEDDGREPGVD